VHLSNVRTELTEQCSDYQAFILQSANVIIWFCDLPRLRELAGEKTPTLWSNQISILLFVSNSAALQLNRASVSNQTLDSHTNSFSSHSLIFGIRKIRETILKLKTIQ